MAARRAHLLTSQTPTSPELTALREATAAARTAGGDVVLLATAAHDRAAQDPTAT